MDYAAPATETCVDLAVGCTCVTCQQFQRILIIFPYFPYENDFQWPFGAISTIFPPFQEGLLADLSALWMPRLMAINRPRISSGRRNVRTHRDIRGVHQSLKAARLNAKKTSRLDVC